MKAAIDAKDCSRLIKPGPTSKPVRRRTDIIREIRDLCDQITREFNPEKIILFGSHAHGTPQWDSDVDPLVIMPFRGRPASQATRIRSRIDTPVALDLLVRTPEQISKRLAMGDFFIAEIMERGKVLYEAHHG
jgi:predicted nucleotidyltransferase